MRVAVHLCLRVSVCDAVTVVCVYLEESISSG